MPIETIQWSGLETPNMKEAKCSLLLPVDARFSAHIKKLPRTQVSVRQDQGDVSCFTTKGCAALQLVPSPNARSPAMPVTITVGGRCFFTAENYNDFSIMMRTNEEAEHLNIPPNSEFEWPGVESLLLCPLCSAKAQIPTDDVSNDYWMIFYPLLQVTDSTTFATRTICRLVCLDCMQLLLDGMYVTVKHSDDSKASLSAMEILQEAGTASFLQDGPPRPETHPHVDDALDAWTLYTLWESTGEWESLQNDYREALARSMMEIPTPVEEAQVKDRYGKKCGNAHCNRVHGKKDKEGHIIRLSVVCNMCKLDYYCSKSCRARAWAVHSLECEAGIKKAKLVHCNTCRKAKPYTKMKKCSRCRSAIYCSAECQKEDWILHKPMCQKSEN